MQFKAKALTKILKIKRSLKQVFLDSVKNGDDLIDRCGGWRVAQTI
jgi:hypothetical protein